MDAIDATILNDKIKKIQRKLTLKIAPHSYMTKIIVIGNTGSGKSSLTGCLTKKNIIITDENGQIELIGPGIHSGMKSGTKVPLVKSIDIENNLIYIDCPGFNDTNGYETEIKNAFIIDYLFKVNSNNKCKILLVISASEFELARGQSILNTIERLTKMFPKVEELEKGIGLVITKGKIELAGHNYISMLCRNAPEKYQKFCQFFKENNDRVFYFPVPMEDKIGQKYEFNDQKKLEQFLQDDYILNITHQIQVNPNTYLFLENIRIDYHQQINSTIKNLFNMFRNSYWEEKKSTLLKEWHTCINKMIGSNISNIKDLKEFISRAIPNSTNCNIDLDQLSNFELLNSFIDKIIDGPNNHSTLHDSILIYANQAILELNELIEFACISEKNEQKIDEMKKRVEESKKTKEYYEEQARKKHQENEAIFFQQLENEKIKYRDEKNRLTNILYQKEREIEIANTRKREMQNHLIHQKEAEFQMKNEEYNRKIEQMHLEQARNAAKIKSLEQKGEEEGCIIF